MSDDLPAVIAEMTAIQAEMGTPAYFKNEDKQARYRELVSRKQSYSGHSSILPNAEPLLPIMSMAEFKAAGGVNYNGYVALNRESADILYAMPAADQADFVEAFEALPHAITDVALSELMARKPASSWSPADEVAAFRKRPEGALLASEWGADTARNLAMVKARLWRVVHALDEDDAPLFFEWLEGLSTGSAAAIYRKLVA